MARPTKQGLDYFPLDVDMDSADERVYILESDYGTEGFGILIKLLMGIYQSNGYYMKWGETEANVFSMRRNLKIDSVINVVNVCINQGFFSANLYEKYHILTSRGVQKRFLECARKRKYVNFIAEYLLLDQRCEIGSGINLVYSYINSVNSEKTPVNSAVSTQRKEKKSKANSAEAVTAINSPETKPKTKTKSKDQQLAEAADMLRIEDPKGYKEFIALHPELLTASPEEVPW